jgi:hypothetical protein
MLNRIKQIIKNFQQKPRWLLFFLVLSGLSILMEVLIQPYWVQAVLNHLPQSVAEQDKLSVVQNLNQELFTRAAFLPIRLLIGWGLFGSFLYYICTFLSPQKTFRFVHIFSLEVHAESALILGKIAMFFRLATEPINIISGLAIPFGCTDFIEVKNYAAFTLLNSVNIFTFAYIAILSVGISMICEMSKVRAFITACIAWGIAILFNVGSIMALQDVFHLLVNK